MRILQVSNGYPPKEKGGIEEYVRTLSQELSKRHKVYVFAREWNHEGKNYRQRHWKDRKVQIYNVVNNVVSPPDFSLSYKNDQIDKLFKELLIKLKPDIVHFHHLYTLSGNLPLIAKELKIPFIFTLHDYWYMCPCIRLVTMDGKNCSGNNPQCVMEYYKNNPSEVVNIYKNSPLAIKKIIPVRLKREIKSWLVKLFKKRKIATYEMADSLINRRSEHFLTVLNLSKILIAPSQFVKDKYKKFGISSKKIKVIPHGIETEKFTNVVKKSSKKIRFGYLGTLFEFKGIHLLVDAFKSLNASNNAELAIYGDINQSPSYYRKLNKMAKGMKNITFHGSYNNNSLPEILSTIDIVVIPSIFPETFSLVAREAQASKTPIIAAKIGSLMEIVKDGYNGILFKPGNNIDLSEKIKMLIANKSIIKKMSSNFETPVNIRTHTVKLSNIYNNIRRY